MTHTDVNIRVVCRQKDNTSAVLWQTISHNSPCLLSPALRLQNINLFEQLCVCELLLHSGSMFPKEQLGFNTFKFTSPDSSLGLICWQRGKPHVCVWFGHMNTALLSWWSFLAAAAVLIHHEVIKSDLGSEKKPKSCSNDEFEAHHHLVTHNFYPSSLPNYSLPCECHIKLLIIFTLPWSLWSAVKTDFPHNCQINFI